jgi:hypothetical protein
LSSTNGRMFCVLGEPYFCTLPVCRQAEILAASVTPRSMPALVRPRSFENTSKSPSCELVPQFFLFFQNKKKTLCPTDSSPYICLL